MQSDILISQQAVLKPIAEIAAQAGLAAEDIEPYGSLKAKISYAALKKLQNSSLPDGKLILVTAVTPTPAGEGKSTVSIGLGDALRRLGKKTAIALREPSLGPCFGAKGGATGGGYSQIAPMEDINLHFTGDIHAVTAAANLLASIIDNHIYQGNSLNLDPAQITWKRSLDLNDRVLRDITVGQGGKINGIERRDHFCISVASEIMAVLCLARDMADLKERLGRIIIGKDRTGRDVRARELNVVGAMAALLKDALKPNLVQTLEHTPALVHGGPFANIAHGCNSLMATRTALKLSDYVVTEAGFGADLGAEKFLDIKCRFGGIKPSVIVVVATVRALKMHGGMEKECLGQENLAALDKGFDNLKLHIENMQKYGVPVVVAVNRFASDTDAEIALIEEKAALCGVKALVSEGWAKGGRGVIALAEETLKACDRPANFKFLYEDELPLEEKIRTVAREIYRAADVEFSEIAAAKLREYAKNGFGCFPVCIAKTQNSVSHDKNLLNAPQGYVLPVRDVSVSAGAGFVVVFAGSILDMPGLPPVPAAEKIDVDENGVVSGLF